MSQPKEQKKSKESEPKKAPRKKPTPQEHLEHYDQLITYLTTEIDRKRRNMEAGVKTLRKARKSLMAMRKELPKIKFTKKIFASPNKRDPVGLTTPIPISMELADFLGVPHTTLISRLDANRAVCVYCHIKEGEDREDILRWSYLNPDGRNLQDPKDRRYILPDQALTELLRYDDYQNAVAKGEVYTTKKDKETGEVTTKQVTSSNLTYFTIQKLLSVHFWVDDEDSI